MSLPRYGDYKDSDIPWLGKIPEHWEVTKTKYVCSFSTGWTPPTGDTSSYEGENLWANISDLGAKTIIDTAKRISDAAALKSGIELSPEGSLLFSFKLSIGQVSFAGCDMFTNEAIATFRGSDELALPFAYYAFPLFLVQNASENIYGAKLLNQELIRGAAYALPPIEEQTAIATFLDRETAKIDALIAEQEKLIALLAEKRQATISHAVTRGLNPNAPMKDSGLAWLGEVPVHWKIGKAGFYVSVLPGYAFSSTDFSLDESNHKLLRGINVGVGELKWDEAVYWARTENDGLDTFELQVGDVVIGMDRPLISSGMRVALVKQHDLPCLLLQRVAKVKPGSSIDGRFVMRLLSSRAFEAHFAPETTGISVPHLSGDQISTFVIPVPPLEEQREICDFLETELTKLDTLHREAVVAIALLAERRSALIAAAVTGQIDVRGLVEPQPT